MKKNIVIITPDQMRADILGCYGNTQIGSTHIDRLAALGTTFDQCYCAAPLCGPSRISFATSTYFSEHNPPQLRFTRHPRPPQPAAKPAPHRLHHRHVRQEPPVHLQPPA